MKLVVALFFSLLFLGSAYCQMFFEGNLPKWKSRKASSDAFKSVGKKLILTPYIENGNDFRARQLAKVDKKLFLNVTSYAGYLTVDSKKNSNLWFWFFPAEGTESLYNDGDYSDYDWEDENRKASSTTEKPSKELDKPLVLWLQGGPGASSLFGLFVENGPFFVNDDGISLKKNNFSWHKSYSMLFIDNPVGSGFSFTDDEEDGYTTDATQVGKHLYKVMMQFLKMFPWLQRVPFFVSGESYAGKWIPAMAYQISKENKNDDSEFPIKLQGLMIGNGFTDPEHLGGHSEFAYQMGLIDYHARNEMQLFEILAKENIPKPEAKVFWDLCLYTFMRYSLYRNLYNVLEPKNLDLESYLEFVDQNHIRKALHVGDQDFAGPSKVYYKHIDDFMNSEMHHVESLLEEGMRIMFYSGNLDFIVAYPLSENSYYHMNWSGADRFRRARRLIYVSDGKVTGYIKRSKNFIEAVVLNAGHMCPTDQPEVTKELIDDFINERI